MFKKLLSVVFTGIMVVSMGTGVFAAQSAPDTTAVSNENVIVLNDPALLDKSDAITSSPGEAQWGGLTLMNRKLIGQRYYSDSPFLVDSIEGPMGTGPQIEFETKETAGFNGECGVSMGDIEASFSVDFSREQTVRRTYQFDRIPAGKYLTYEAFVNYNVYEFDVYDGYTYLGKSQYWTPVGIVVNHDVV